MYILCEISVAFSLHKYHYISKIWNQSKNVVAEYLLKMTEK